jgi:hypothetical protein
MDCYFCASDKTLLRSPILRQEEFKSLISAMTIVGTLPSGAVELCKKINDTSVI